jgi:maltooligosyltrehalose trehalohydrolase
MKSQGDGHFVARVRGVAAGTRYRYCVDGHGPFPDPASRWQPEGVHGPSEVCGGPSFFWSDRSWRGLPHKDLIIYELHVGTFTPAGTFAGVTERLADLVDLGVTAIELLPVADFSGQRNWGYDGVALFAPARCYGRPDDLRRLVDTAHRIGLAVILDVVYNHLGPDGNYLSHYDKDFFNPRTAWGPGPNFSRSNAREFVIENALYWLHEFHCDGLRLDATQAIVDTSRVHILAELAARVRASIPHREVVLIVEDSRNLAQLLRPVEASGWGYDGVWADDFHHQLRRLLAGDREGYYRDFRGNINDLAKTIRQGWFYCGQKSVCSGRPRGTDPAGLHPRQFVYCLQNHDQVGNRARGDRLHHVIDAAPYRAASALLLGLPHTPLLFMGQEWATSRPFQFFTDFPPTLGQRVTEGRRRDYGQFKEFSDPKMRNRIPDPQAESTYLASRLDWSERAREPFAAMYRFYRQLLRLRRQARSLRGSDFTITAHGSAGLLLERRTEGETLHFAIRLRGRGTVPLPHAPGEVVLTSESAEFCADSQEPRIDTRGVHFRRPGAVVLRTSH